MTISIVVRKYCMFMNISAVVKRILYLNAKIGHLLEPVNQNHKVSHMYTSLYLMSTAVNHPRVHLSKTRDPSPDIWGIHLHTK